MKMIELLLRSLLAGLYYARPEDLNPPDQQEQAYHFMWQVGTVQWSVTTVGHLGSFLAAQ